MEDFRFDSKNKFLNNLSGNCWHVTHNNNNVHDCSSIKVKNFSEDILKETTAQRKKQREITTAVTNSATNAIAVVATTTATDVTTAEHHSVCGALGVEAMVNEAAPITITASAGTPTYVCRIEDEGGGSVSSDNITTETGIEKTDKSQRHVAATPASYNCSNTIEAVVQPPAQPPLSQQQQINNLSFEPDATAAAAVAFSPSETIGATGIGSNRTSMNNSTENLSFSSDNFYPDDLILLDDGDANDDVEAEEISLNSDDCVYAYRGDGADFDLDALDSNIRRGRRVDSGTGLAGLGAAEDETEFLEMDFEPDPLSEAEFVNFNATGIDQANLFLMQRDYSQLSGRHSATNMSTSLHATLTASGQRQHFSSPIDDLPPQQALQTQAQRLNKSFARISLHLDQIKDDANEDINTTVNVAEDVQLRRRIDGLGLDCNDIVQQTQQQTAHSLPNTIYTNFGRDTNAVAPDVTKSPTKITGAKPKRISTFSTSSSVSSKNSSKSRSSLRSSYAPPHGNSASFDERCVSCTDFRTCASALAATVATAVPPPPPSATSTVAINDCTTPMLAVAAAAVVAATAVAAANTYNFDFSANEETCLDCLEKEFLANTIGTPVDLSSCVKCRNKRSSSLSLYTQAEQTRCRSGSPSYFMELRDDSFFNTTNMPTPRKRGSDWSFSNMIAQNHLRELIGATSMLDENQRATSKCNKITNSGNCSLHLFKSNFLRVEEEQTRISTAHLSEETLVQALEKFHVAYNVTLIKIHFEQLSKPIISKNFKNLKDFILHAAKQHCNHRKYKKLIELATYHQLEVQFKKDADYMEPELIPLQNADILELWSRCKNLTSLHTLDKRFQQANILGKIANVVRVNSGDLNNIISGSGSDSSSSTSSAIQRRPLSEFILIPQYYQRGELTLRRKC